jgi:hypothetical protein
VSGFELSGIALVCAVFVWCAVAATWWLFHELFGGD